MQRILCFAFAIAFAGPVAGSEQVTLTKKEAIARALQQHPLLTAARKKSEAAQGRKISVSAFPNPSFVIVPMGTTADNPIVFEQVLELPFKRSLRVQASDREVAASLAEYQATVLDVTLGVKVAYAELQAAVSIRVLTEEAAELSRTLRDLAQKQHAIGAVPLVHILRTDIESQQVEQEVIQARAEVFARQVALNLAMGQETSVPVLPAEELSYQPLSLSAKALKALALEQRPEIQAAQHRLTAQRFIVKSLRAQRLPDLFALARLGEDQRAVRLTAPRFGIGITLPLLDLGRISGEIRAAQAQVEEQEAVLDQTKRVVLAEVETATQRVLAASQVVETYQQRIVPIAEDLLKRIKAAYAEGGSTLLELIDAQQTWRRTRRQLVEATATYVKAVAYLERAVGGELPLADTNPERSASQ
ncbi:MAG: TolC family protein [Armatimonadetes bacterium]|nr:TolC family protein [Armatimonadota bacterium]MDW8122001.1 TolC family protein [Armatimonadota bacterium]